MDPVEDHQEAPPPPEEEPADSSSAALSAPVATSPAPGRARRIGPWAVVMAAGLVIVLIATTLIVVHQTTNSTNKGASAASTPSGLSIYGLAQPVIPVGNPLPFDNARAATAQQDANGSVFALNAADGRLRWNYKTPDGVETGQVVADGVLYTGSSNGNVYALDAGTGKVLWSVKLLEQSEVGQVVNGVVYAWSSAGTENSQGNVYTLDARSGKQLWQFAGGGGVDLVSGDTVYVNSAGDPSQTVGTIYALNASTGAERWHFQGQGSLSAQGVTDGQVYVIGLQAVDPSDTNLLGFQATLSVLDASTGTLRWSYPQQPSGNLSLVGVENGMVYVYVTESSPDTTLSDSLVALNVADGMMRWEAGFSLLEFPADSGTTTTTGFLIGGLPHAWLSDGVIYIGSQNDPVSAIDARTGNMLWTNLQLEIEAGQPLTLDMVANGVVYLAEIGDSANLGLYALDAHTGRLLWKRLGKFLTVGAVVNGVVYATTADLGPPFTPRADDNSVVALDASTGAVRWSYSLGKEMANIIAQ